MPMSIAVRRPSSRVLPPLLLSLALLAGTRIPSAAAQTGTGTGTVRGNPSADQLLRSMSDYLRGLQQFSFVAEITEDQFFEPGQRLQFGRTATVMVRRPDRLRAVSTGDMGRTQFFYDGEKATLVDLQQNRYATFPVRGSLDAALKKGTRSYGLRAPLSHVLYSDAYASLPSTDRLGTSIGVAKIRGQSCHHLAFRQKDVDWQIWIRTGERPLPCKRLVTAMDRENKGLQFSALFTQWKTAADFPAGTFSFRPPAGQNQVEIAPADLPSPLSRP